MTCKFLNGLCIPSSLSFCTGAARKLAITAGFYICASGWYEMELRRQHMRSVGKDGDWFTGIMVSVMIYMKACQLTARREGTNL